MASNKSNKTNVDFEAEEQEVRDEVLAGPLVAPDPAINNRELERADRHVNTEVTTPAERRAHGRGHLASGNRTLAGAPSDVHQALVTLSNMHRDEDAAYNETQAVLAKYKDSEELHPDVRAHLEAYSARLAPFAKLYRDTRTLLEEHV